MLSQNIKGFIQELLTPNDLMTSVQCGGEMGEERGERREERGLIDILFDNCNKNRIVMKTFSLIFEDDNFKLLDVKAFDRIMRM